MPAPLLVPAALGLALVTLPVLCLPRGVSFGQLPSLAASAAARDALTLSLITTTTATALVLLLGTPLALFLARGSGRGRGVLRGVLLVPLALPPVVGGMALLSAFGRRGVLGEQLDALGVRIAFSTTAVVLAQAFVALPFFALAFASALAAAGEAPERAAAGLGARPWQVLWRVTLPRMRPALIAATALAFARALGEFGATLTFAGSFQGVTRTLPLEVYLQREVDPASAQALSLAFLIVAVGLVLLTLWADRRRPGPDPVA
ncbi:NifC-like ABC-type porter [Segniliparus rugosus ATCC BAA-974]|uniref:Molybdenum transport system permease n=1 Tax=Segniliparus rugosus (strain ATCC BAA-974 / DSM 45345 / CCUG 50838 / CIP 108380 / JCM 13579 / CDC 945) TaxID=679197 RepID=U1N4X9_SEGRC|nr:NifC-like ABC-type porter [Segniliparus rugosus ATCC BAA-974]